MSKNKLLTAALVVAGVFSLGYKTVAQTGGGTTTSPSDTMSPPSAPAPPSSGSTMSSPQTSLGSSDKRFMLQAAQGGTAEVQIGQLATQKASSDQVKQYAQQMVEQHSQVNSQLAALAAQKGVTLSTTLSSKYQSTYDQLSKLSGTAFDRAYISQAGVKAHTQQADLFKRESQQGKDPEVKALAAQTLPAVEDHLKMARDIASGKTVGSGSMSAPGGSMTPSSPAPSP